MNPNARNSMRLPGQRDGVLGRAYACDRQDKPAVVFRWKTRARLAADSIRRHMPRADGLLILDIGCAEGLALLELDRLLPGCRFVGVEYSAELLDTAVGLPANVSLARGDATALPESLAADSFDVVVAMAVLEHLVRPGDAVREAARVLKPGGLFVASCPSPGWARLSHRLGLLEETQHEHNLSGNVLWRLTEEAGLRVVESRPFMWAPISFLPYLRVPISPEFALRADERIARLRLFDRLFVNRAIVARKPG